MKTLFLTSFAAVLTLVQVSCATKKNAHSSKEGVTVAKVEKQDSLFASLKKNACFGSCPVYELKIYKSGYATFEGKANTEIRGLNYSKFTKSQMDSIVSIAKSINYFELNDVYDDKRMLDIPSIESSVAIKGIRKSVYKRYSYPESLSQLENYMEQAAYQLKWQPLK